MVISFFDITKEEQNVFQILSNKNELHFYKQSITSQNAKHFEKTNILYIRSFSQATDKVLRQLPNLRFLTTRSTGFDNVDIDFCKKRRIVVSNVPTYATNAVAEHTFALLLDLTHSITACALNTRRKDFSVGPQGYDISGKTIGIIGFGNIGSRVAQIAKGFDMQVIAVTEHPSAERANKHGITFVDMNTLLKKSDIVSMHVPMTDETYHMINTSNITKMKHGSILLNTSRGEVIDTRAITWALDNSVVSWVGLDVLEDEMELKRRRYSNGKISSIQELNYKLMMDSRVIITPHNAYHTKESIDRIMAVSLKNIEAYIKETPINRVV